MGNRQRFIIKWERERRKGKVKYIIRNMLPFVTTYWIVACIIIAFKGRGLNQISNYITFFIGTFIGFLIALPIKWEMNEEKYNQLLREIQELD